MGFNKPTSLREYLKHEQPGLAVNLDIFSALVEQIDGLNAENIVYNDLNPSNIEIDIVDKSVSLIPSTLSFDLSAPLYDPKIDPAIRGDVAYISPECTGRTAHMIDFRSDYYSLGIILHQLLTGRPPFDFIDPLQTLHAHVAVVPTPVEKIDGRIPQTLSRIVSKLLEKNPADRYQSAAGLLTDIANCNRQLNAKQRIDDFPIAMQDVSPVFKIPNKLYGRYREIKDLINEFKHVRNGGSGIVFLLGPPGVGKSSLVNEVQRHLVGGDNNGNFISGKFDPYEETIPFSAIIQAISGIIRRMLTLPDDMLKSSCETILKAVGTNGGLIIDVIPELALIIGKQPPPPKLPPMEARNRFNYVVYKFAKAVVKFAQPLIIFLDDLQWAESASINAIRAIFMDSALDRVMFIGAYRDIEATNNPFLAELLRHIRQTKSEAQFIRLEPVDKESVGIWIQDMFAIDEPDASKFIDLIADRTACNPLFIKEFLIYLHAEGLLRYMPARHRENSVPWHVDIKRIIAAEIPDSIRTLLIKRLGKLPQATQACLKTAACIGSRFTPALLAAVCKQQKSAVEALLQQTVDQGILIQAGDGFKFIHDRIRETTYQMIDPHKRTKIHYAVGKALLSGVQTISCEPVFEIASQLNSAIQLLDGNERTQLIQLNLSAGKKAKRLTAYSEALGYFKTSLKLLGEKAWERHYDIALDVHTEAAETAYLCSDFEFSEKLIQRVIRNAQSVMDQLRGREIRSRYLFAQHRLLEAIDEGLSMQQMLGCTFPNKPGRLRVLRELSALWPQLRKTTPADLNRLREVRDSKVLTHSRILACIGIPSVPLIPNLSELMLLRILRTTFSQGLTPESSGALASLGAALCKFGLMDAGYRLGQTALALIQRPHADSQEKARTLFCVYASMCWQGHIRESLQPLLDAYKLGLESGDREIAAHAALIYCTNLWSAGTPLTDTLFEVNHYINIMRQNRQQMALSHLQSLQQLILCEMGHFPSDLNPIEDFYGREDKTIASDNDLLMRKHLLHMFLNSFKGNYAAAVLHSDRAVKFTRRNLWAFKEALYYTDSLMRIGLIDSYTASGNAKRFVWQKLRTWFAVQHQLRKIAANQIRLKKAARRAPMNFINKWMLIEAEHKRIRGKRHQAEQYYKQAIDLSKKHLFLPEQALANELLAKHLLVSEEQKRGRKHLERALKLYEKYGAAGKKRRLLKEYRTLLMPPDTEIETGKPISNDAKNPCRVSSLNLAEMGLQLFSESLNSISTKADAKNHLLQLSKNILHYTGAQRVLLLLNFTPLSIGVDHQIGKTPLALTPMRKDTSFPEMIIQYVLRTQTDLLLDDAGRSDMFSSDPYIQKHQVKSVICTPLIFQNRLSTILYLENNVSIGVFTPRLQKLLKGLSSQIALLLEHKALKNMQSRYPVTPFGDDELKEMLKADHGLTAQEAKIALLFKAGHTRAQISEALHISAQTLRKHMQMIYDKTVNMEDNFTSEGRVDKLSRLIIFLFKLETRNSANTPPPLNAVDSDLYLSCMTEEQEVV